MKLRTPVTVAVLLATSACGLTGRAVPPPSESPSASPSASPSGAPPATSPAPATPPARAALAESRSTLTPDLKMEVTGLNRMGGEHLAVQMRLTNTGTGTGIPWTGQLGDETRPLGEIRWASGIGVLDAAARSWILPYQPAGSPCLCSDQRRDDLPYSLDPGQSVDLYAILPAPAGSPATATVVTPAGPPMPDVPISDEPPVTPPGVTLPDPADGQVTTLIRRIVTPSESPDRSEETADDGTDLRVSLSSDVLFALNRATLTARAKAVLARTAGLVDASPGGIVTVEGHADSSGTHAVNDPLSVRRAQAVRAALSALVTRDGVGFTARGYGSRRPLYDNGTDEGRRRNRRVTVTFAKPEPAPAASPSAEAAATPADTGLTGSTKADGQPIGLEVTGLRRLSGGLGLLTYRVTNQGDAEAWYNELHHAKDWMSFKYQSAANVTLTDEAGRRRYLPGRLQVPAGNGGVDSYCACTGVSGVRLAGEKFAPGQEREFWGLFELPATAPEVTVKIADFGALRVPVGG
ncbi:OmpA family protein [Nonomuraea sp. SBT364]|uniref:OmpA family protein n=1 Tax=Nonomuraea sp. SBT364 TaxID=1580530 RepID=UPI0018CE0C26|nr:OmpA family protein [Nonomuraea sp. SBT364]